MRHCDFHSGRLSSTYWWMGPKHHPFRKPAPLHLCDECAAKRQKLAQDSGRTLYLDQACSRPVAAAAVAPAVPPAAPVPPVQPSPDLGEGAEVGGHPSSPEARPPQEPLMPAVSTESPTVCVTCGTPGPLKAKSRCARCYDRQHREAKKAQPAPKLSRKVVKPCSHPGCGQPFKAKGLCNGHYKAWLKRQGPGAVSNPAVPPVVAVPSQVSAIVGVGLTYEQIATTMREGQFELDAGGDLLPPWNILDVTGDVQSRDPSPEVAPEDVRLAAALVAFRMKAAPPVGDPDLLPAWERIRQHLLAMANAGSGALLCR